MPMLHVLADLHAWGRPPQSRWWALVSWSVYAATPTGNQYIHRSAWVHEDRIERSRDPTVAALYRTVERFDLPADPDAWPTPAASAGRFWQHYGVLHQAPSAVTGIVPFTLPDPDPPRNRA